MTMKGCTTIRRRDGGLEDGRRRYIFEDVLIFVRDYYNDHSDNSHTSWTSSICYEEF